jgi:hypothetical protein
MFGESSPTCTFCGTESKAAQNITRTKLYKHAIRYHSGTLDERPEGADNLNFLTVAGILLALGGVWPETATASFFIFVFWRFYY